MKEAIAALVDFGDDFEVALANQVQSGEMKVMLPEQTLWLVQILISSSNDGQEEGLSAEQALASLFEFGSRYVIASRQNCDPNQKLREIAQMLLAILTDQVASPIDVESVFPHDEVLTDA